MAAELKLTVSAVLTKGSHKERFEPGTISIDQSTIGAHCPVVSVGTSEEDLSVGDVGTLGYLIIQNLDSTNYVTWGPKSAGAMVALGRIKAGEVAVLRLEPGITLRWQANTAAVKVKAYVLEN